MLLDSRVNRRKYDREVSRARSQSAFLAKRGCMLLDATYPNVDVLILPDLPLRLHLLVSRQGNIVFPAPGVPAKVELGLFTARPFVARIGLDDFDLLAPSVRFLDARTREPLGADQPISGMLKNENGQVQEVVIAEHPVHKRRFLCLRGIREYHDHPQHTGDDWMLYRGSIGLMDVIDLIWRTCVDVIRPNVHVWPQFGIQWNYEVRK